SDRAGVESALGISRRSSRLVRGDAGDAASAASSSASRQLLAGEFRPLQPLLRPRRAVRHQRPASNSRLSRLPARRRRGREGGLSFHRHVSLRRQRSARSDAGGQSGGRGVAGGVDRPAAPGVAHSQVCGRVLPRGHAGAAGMSPLRVPQRARGETARRVRAVRRQPGAAFTHPPEPGPASRRILRPPCGGRSVHLHAPERSGRVDARRTACGCLGRSSQSCSGCCSLKGYRLRAWWETAPEQRNEQRNGCHEWTHMMQRAAESRELSARTCDALIIVPPFFALRYPRLGADVLKTGAGAAGFRVRVFYATLLFASHIGLPSYTTLAKAPSGTFLGERLFARAAYGVPPLGDHADMFTPEQIFGTGLAPAIYQDDLPLAAYRLEVVQLQAPVPAA